MKKEFVFFGLLFLVMFIGVVAGANDTDSSGIGAKANDFLENEIEIPEGLKIVTRIAFGLGEDENIDFQRFVILLGIWVIFLIFVWYFLKLIPLFDKNWTAWAAAVIVTLLIGTAKGFIIVVNLLFDILEGVGIARFAIIIIVLIVLVFFLLGLGRRIKKSSRVENAKRMGRDIATAAEIAKIDAESLE